MSLGRSINEWQFVLEQFERLGRTLGVSVKYEGLGEEGDVSQSHGGFCILRGQSLILVEHRLPPNVKCRVLASAFRQFDLSQVFVMPVIRDLITKHSEPLERVG